MAETNIDWADWSWNWLRGCSRISPGCGSSSGGGCYAERDAWRWSAPGMPYHGLVRMTAHGPRWTGTLRYVLEKLDEPLHWRKPRRVFVNSTSDTFHKKVPFSWIDGAFARMAIARTSQFLTLTKRADIQRAYFADPKTPKRVARIVERLANTSRWSSQTRIRNRAARFEWPLPNVWSGVSVEDQDHAEIRVPDLLETACAHRWVSAEPLLGEIDFEKIKHGKNRSLNALHGVDENPEMFLRTHPLDWVVIGGESGLNARTFSFQWARDILEACRFADVPAFVKQVGARPSVSPTDRNQSGELLVKIGKLTAKKGNDPAEWPLDLQIRQYPNVLRMDT